jgi:hypothetical protein
LYVFRRGFVFEYFEDVFDLLGGDIALIVEIEGSEDILEKVFL